MIINNSNILPPLQIDLHERVNILKLVSHLKSLQDAKKVTNLLLLIIILHIAMAPHGKQFKKFLIRTKLQFLI